MHLSTQFGQLVNIVPVVLLLSTPVLADYQWPSPQIDALERLLYEGTEFSGFPIATLATNCVERAADSPSPIAAEWLRLVSDFYLRAILYIGQDLIAHNLFSVLGVP